MLCYIYWQRKWANGPNPQGHSHCFLRLILACSFYFCLLFSFSKEKEHKEGKCFSCKHLKSTSNDANILGSSKAIWTVIIEANGLWTPNNWVRVKGFHQPTSYVLEKWGGVTDFEAIPITRAFLQGSSYPWSFNRFQTHSRLKIWFIGHASFLISVFQVFFCYWYCPRNGLSSPPQNVSWTVEV